VVQDRRGCLKGQRRGQCKETSSKIRETEDIPNGTNCGMQIEICLSDEETETDTITTKVLKC